MKIWTFVAIVGLCVSGCTKTVKPVPTVQVSGNVLVGGKPLEGVEVRFIGEKSESYGKTDSQGNYQLVAGAQVGSNKVTFNKIVGAKSAMKLDLEAGIDETQIRFAQEAMQGQSGIAVQKDLIPEEFRTREKTPIVFDVSEDGTDKADFKLPAK